MNYKEKVHDKLIILASSMLANTISTINRYECIRNDHQTWKVRKKKNNVYSTRSKIFCTPNFDVINTINLMDISIEEVKQLGCTCTYTKVYGMPCVNALMVANTMKPH